MSKSTSLGDFLVWLCLSSDTMKCNRMKFMRITGMQCFCWCWWELACSFLVFVCQISICYLYFLIQCCLHVCCYCSCGLARDQWDFCDCHCICLGVWYILCKYSTMCWFQLNNALKLSCILFFFFFCQKLSYILECSRSSVDALPKRTNLLHMVNITAILCVIGWVWFNIIRYTNLRN